ncbi:MAG TPA: glycoside hydrolase family 3 C-terminal domain-containing protein, partial [Polyangiaceae bacterium]
YNKINGVKNTQNKHLLRDILKAPVNEGGFGYQGLVLSDWWAMPGDNNDVSADAAASATKEAVLAGLDIEVPWTLHYSTTTLQAADQSLVTDAARRVLTQKFRFKSATDQDGWSKKGDASLKSKLDGASIATNPDHEAIAEESELKSAVLLKNGDTAPLLPLSATASKIAVLGPDREFTLFTSTVPKSCPPVEGKDPRYCNFHFATDAALGDRGSSRVNGDPARTVGPFQGIKDAAGADRTVTSGNTADAVPDADTLVVVVGYTAGDEGEEYAISEGGDRHTLDLPMGQNEFVNTVLSRNKPTIIIINSGSIVNLPWLAHSNKNQATIWAGYGGMRVGSALGKLIFGTANFSGKMPMAWPTQAEQDKLAFKDQALSTRMGYFFGYREYDRRKAAGPIDMVFPFGHGMSYSTFEYSNLQMPCQTATQDAVFNIKVDVKNTAGPAGDEVVMLFVKPPAKPDGVLGDRPVKELKSFARVSVPAAGTTTAELPLRIRDLRRWAPDAPAETSTTGKWVIDPGVYTVLIGKDADDADTTAIKATFTIN